MIRAHDANGRFVCFGTYVRAPSGATYGAFPDDDEAVKDDVGNALVSTKRSTSYGFRLCSLARPDLEAYELACAPKDVKAVYMAGEAQVLGFMCWYSSPKRCVVRFGQYGDPRLNGSPVVNRKIPNQLLGMYMVHSWADETRAECVPRDLLSDAPLPGWDPRRGDVAAEVASGWGSKTTPMRVSRALEIGSFVFYETYDKRAKWVTHVYADREFVYEGECRFLMDSFPDVVRKLEAGERRSLCWSSGATLEFRDAEPRGVGFSLQRSVSAEASQESGGDVEEEYPCIDV